MRSDPGDVIGRHQTPAGAALYTLGYQGRSPAGLVAIIEHLDVTVIDVRAVPNSRAAHWRRGALASLLGGRYQWRGDVLGGRVGGRTGPTAEGFAWLREELAAGRRMALMCMERAPGDCHRWGAITRGRFPEAEHIYLAPDGADYVTGCEAFTRYVADVRAVPPWTVLHIG